MGQPVFGEVADPFEQWDEAQLAPIPFTLVGYSIETRERVEFEFTATGYITLGAQFDAAAAMDRHGKIDNQRVVEFIEKQIAAEDRGRFLSTIGDDRYLFDITALVDLADWIRDIRAERADRPTRPSIASAGGRQQRGRTSAAAASGKGSATRRSSR